jgi:ubiquinone/menaquinone biosynthesis C-methylase UbiE
LVEAPFVLDFGAGTGNVTGHLLKLGAMVIADDVSRKSLAGLRNNYSDASRLEMVELNGRDFSMFKGNSLDMVATYSMLHHVPGYLGVVNEFVRVVMPGGIIYIDHERAPQVWQQDGGNYRKYMTEYECAYGRSFCERLVRKFRNLLSYSAWQGLVNWKLFGLRVGAIFMLQKVTTSSGI